MTPRDLDRRLGYRFADRALLDRALTHRSRTHEAKSPPLDNYERLEFLGDSLLGFLVADWLSKAAPTADEGELTRCKQAVVSTAPLAAAAREIGLGAALRLGRGEEETGGRQKTSLLADAFEAVVAAIYLDGGLRPARAFVRRHLKTRLLAVVAAQGGREDHKTRLQETAQARLRLTPRYRIVETSGPAHDRTFTAEVLLGEAVAGRGVGSSRKQAEQEAARTALAELR